MDISKLGITPIEIMETYYLQGECVQTPVYVVGQRDLSELENHRNELLKNLITGVLMIEKQDEFIPIDSEEYSFRNNSIDIIEKACYPKKWDEIKKIIGDQNGNKNT